MIYLQLLLLVIGLGFLVVGVALDDLRLKAIAAIWLLSIGAWGYLQKAKKKRQ
jgi:hypothetical protein